MSDRHYAQDEIQAIFRRAAERQQAAAHPEERAGLTLPELEAIGAESGLDPAHVAAAARDLERIGGPPAPRSLLERLYGTNVRLTVERTLPGAMDDAAWAEAVKALRSAFDAKGTADAVGTLREWSVFASPDGRTAPYAYGSGWNVFASPDGRTAPYAYGSGWNAFASPDGRTAPYAYGSGPRDPLTGIVRCPVYVEAESDPQGAPGRTRFVATARMRTSSLWEGPIMTGLFALLVLAMSAASLAGDFPAFLPMVMGVLAAATPGLYRFAVRREMRRTRERLTDAFDRIERLHADRTPTDRTPAAEAPLASDRLDARPEEADVSRSARRTRA